MEGRGDPGEQRKWSVGLALSTAEWYRTNIEMSTDLVIYYLHAFRQIN